MNIKVKNLSGGISIITIDEPKTYNSLSFKNLNDLIKVFKNLDKDKKTKVIILEGSGKGFSAGHNLKEVKNLKVRNKYLGIAFLDILSLLKDEDNWKIYNKLFNVESE